MKATKTQKEVMRTVTEKQDVYTLELSHAEAAALYTLVGQSTYALCQNLARTESIAVEGAEEGMTIDWIIHNAIADLVEPPKEDE